MKNLLLFINVECLLLFFLLSSVASCSQTTSNSLPNNVNVSLSVDVLIEGGMVYTGDNLQSQMLDIAICQKLICGIYPTGSHQIQALKTINAMGKVVSPGFIDPHTHSLEELFSTDNNHNLNYLTQGVTTVINGNDGGGPVDVRKTADLLIGNGIGTNVGLYIGHGSVREEVMGREQRHATADEIKNMSDLVATAMQSGAIGFSTGLYYVPGSYANTEEVITLAKTASQYNGIYDTHLRDESTFNIGFLAALDEAIYIAKEADIHLHLAHIKALGVDVWGQSDKVIPKIEAAQASGISISADQYPWLASGTSLKSALMPKWLMADSEQAFHKRLNQDELALRIKNEVLENLRRRGGAESILITAFKDKNLVGLNLLQVAKKRGDSVFNTIIQLVQEGKVRVASFNMSVEDVEKFMIQPWVVTSSDGTNGHPRKYASFPKKYQDFVVKKKLLSVGEFIYKSSAQTAKILGLSDRGVIKVGFKADIIVFDEKEYDYRADFSHWDKYTQGVDFVLVNGEVVIEQRKYVNKLSGEFVHK